MRHIDLFAGIGGFSRAVEWLGGETVAFVEWDAWNRRVLARHWPGAHFHGDIKTLTADVIRGWGVRAIQPVMAHAGHDESSGRLEVAEGQQPGGERSARSEPSPRDSYGHKPIDLITGGYPCQPFSLAGQRLGAEDDRHLWPEMRRVIDLCRPRLVLAENVSGHVTMGLDTVLSDLEADGYTCGAVVVPACAVNALHRRDRVWIIASDTHSGRRAQHDTKERPVPEPDGYRDEQSPGMAHAGRGDGDGRPGTPGGNVAHGPDTGRAQGAGGSDQRGQGVGDTNGTGPQGRGQRVGSARKRLAGPASREPIGVAGQAPRQMDIGPDGLPTGLVRRPATGPAEPDLIRAAWADGSWDWDLPRVVSEEPERRQKLQAAGNAIVAVVAYEILRVMLADAA